MGENCPICRISKTVIMTFQRTLFSIKIYFIFKYEYDRYKQIETEHNEKGDQHY